MRVLHAAALLHPSSGIVQQMEGEQAAAVDLGIGWDVRLFCPRGSVKESVIAQSATSVAARSTSSAVRDLPAWLALRREYCAWLREQQVNYDVLLLRNSFHDPYQLSFLRKAARPAFIVCHTLEGPELAGAGGVSGSLRARAESIIGPRGIRAARGVIGVTPEIVKYEMARSKRLDMHCTVYPNGIAYGPIATDGRTRDLPELLFVASTFAPWHGLDLLLAAVSRSTREFVLHVVGSVSAEQCALAAADSRVRFHGRMSHSEILSLAARCTLGLSSFALFRNGMEQACTLKVREYLMLGLPVYAGHQDVFPAQFPYFTSGSCDINMILSFASDNRLISRSTVSAKAAPYVEKKALLRNLYEWLKEDIDSDN